MKSIFIKGMDEKGKKELEQSFIAARMPLEALRKAVQEFKSELGVTLPGDFETPQWALKRAYEDGQVYAYNKILDLLEIK